VIQNAKILHISINASPEAVYDFVSQPEHMAQWAPNFGRAMTRSGTDWVMESPDGPFGVSFEAPNTFGVLDHWVVAPDGSKYFNPIRVVANGSGSLISFTLFQHPSWSDEKLEADARLVSGDLMRLKELMDEPA
jgi:uncharacterized protein YndB with AHSA1/START domain